MKQPSRPNMVQQKFTYKYTQDSQPYIYNTSSSEHVRVDTALQFSEEVYKYLPPMKTGNILTRRLTIDFSGETFIIYGIN